MPFLSARPLSPVVWPTGLLPSLRLLWQRTLFPGQTKIDSRTRPASLLILIVLPAVLLYPCLSFFLLDPDEGRYAEIPREMLARGEWIVPYLHGEPYLDKPPLLYWLIMLSYSVFGVHDWAARIVPALAVHGTILTTYLFGRNRLGERAAFLGALLLSLSPGLMGMGRLLILDGLLTFWVTLGLFAGWSANCGSRGWILCAIACGFGVLTKGPVTLVLVLAPLAIDNWLNGRQSVRTRRDWLLFAAIVLAINLPWYLAIAIMRPEFGLYFFVQHNVQRFLAPFDHLEPIWFYVPIVLGGLLPGTLLLWGFHARPDLGRHRGRRAAKSAAGIRAPGRRLVRALLFALGLQAADVHHAGISDAVPRPGFLPLHKPTRGNGWVFKSALAVWFLLLMIAHHIAIPWYAGHRSPMGAPAEELRAACSDPSVAVCCYPRSCDSAGFYLQREDLQATRSKLIHLLIADLLTRERTVVLCTHGHSFELLEDSLPPELTIAHSASFRRTLPGPAWLTTIVGDSPWGLCDVTIIHNSRPRAADVEQSP